MKCCGPLNVEKDALVISLERPSAQEISQTLVNDLKRNSEEENKEFPTKNPLIGTISQKNITLSINENHFEINNEAPKGLSAPSFSFAEIEKGSDSLKTPKFMENGSRQFGFDVNEVKSWVFEEEEPSQNFQKGSEPNKPKVVTVLDLK